MLSGISAYQRADYPGAVKQWEKLLSLLDPTSPDAQQMQANIADARAQGKMPPADATKLPPVPAAAAAGGMTPEMINQMVERLANRLKDNPNDYTGWARLANAYKVQGKLDEAVQAFGKTGPLLDSDANMITQYADVLATRAQGDFKGQPITLINKALSLDPKQPNALMMAAQAAYQAKDYAKAITHWETVLTILPAGSADASQVQAEIADAKAKSTKP
jgi:cytochrome c-type biogenesis protein CcmH